MSSGQVITEVFETFETFAPGAIPEHHPVTFNALLSVAVGNSGLELAGLRGPTSVS
jgi:hypothetical protein